MILVQCRISAIILRELVLSISKVHDVVVGYDAQYLHHLLGERQDGL